MMLCVRVLLLSCAALISCYSVSKTYVIHSSEQFSRCVNARPLCVAYFYDYVQTCKRKQEKAENREQLEIVKATSCVPEYRRAEVSFLVVNTALPKLSELACDYCITTRPAFMVFRDGIPYQKQGQDVVLEGCATKADLKALIDEHVGEDIQRIVAQKEEARRRRLEESVWLYNYYGYPWYGYCRPCGWGPGYGYGGYYGDGPCYSPWYGGCGGRGKACVNFGMSFCN